MTEITIVVLGTIALVWLLKNRSFRIKAGIGGLEIEASTPDDEKDEPPAESPPGG